VDIKAKRYNISFVIIKLRKLLIFVARIKKQNKTTTTTTKIRNE